MTAFLALSMFILLWFAIAAVFVVPRLGFTMDDNQALSVMFLCFAVVIMTGIIVGGIQ